MIVNLKGGESFSEATFLPDTGFELYSARAARNLQLCYLPPELLLTLVRKHSQIQEHLYRQAQKFNSAIANAEPVEAMVVPQAKSVVVTETELKMVKKGNKAY